MDDRYEIDKKKIPASEYFSNPKEQEDSGVTVIFEQEDNLPNLTRTVGSYDSWYTNANDFKHGASICRHYSRFDVPLVLQEDIEGICDSVIEDCKTDLRDYENTL